MAQKSKSRTYEENYSVLERITESLNKDEIGIDDLVQKTREALDAARTCMEILDKQKGEFKKLETEFSQLLSSSSPTGQTQEPPPTQPPAQSASQPEPQPPSQPVRQQAPPPPAEPPDDTMYGDDDPF